MMHLTFCMLNSARDLPKMGSGRNARASKSAPSASRSRRRCRRRCACARAGAISRRKLPCAYIRTYLARKTHSRESSRLCTCTCSVGLRDYIRNRDQVFGAIRLCRLARRPWSLVSNRSIFKHD